MFRKVFEMTELDELKKLEFTENEKIIVNNVAKKMLDPESTFTKEELETYADFKSQVALRNDQWKKVNEMRRENEQAIIDECKRTEELARKKLDDLAQAAFNRLERMENVK